MGNPHDRAWHQEEKPLRVHTTFEGTLTLTKSYNTDHGSVIVISDGVDKYLKLTKDDALKLRGALDYLIERL